MIDRIKVGKIVRLPDVYGWITDSTRIAPSIQDVLDAVFSEFECLGLKNEAWRIFLSLGFDATENKDIQDIFPRRTDREGRTGELTPVGKARAFAYCSQLQKLRKMAWAQTKTRIAAAQTLEGAILDVAYGEDAMERETVYACPLEALHELEAGLGRLLYSSQEKSRSLPFLLGIEAAWDVASEQVESKNLADARKWAREKCAGKPARAND